MASILVPAATYPPYPNQKLPYVTWKERGGWWISWPAQGFVPGSLFWAIHETSSDPAFGPYWLQDWLPIEPGPFFNGIEYGPLHAQVTYTAFFATDAVNLHGIPIQQTFTYTLVGQ